MDRNNEYYETENEDAIDRLRKGPKSWMNLLIILINILVFAAVELTGSSLDTMHMVNWGAAATTLINQGQYYRLLTSMFLHFGISHIFNNMVLLVFIGDYLEKEAGRLRYLIIYLGGGLIASAASWLYSMNSHQEVVSAGASGGVFAVIGGLLYIVIRNKGRLENLSLQRLLLMAALSIYVGLNSAGVDNSAHIGGLIGGFLLAVLVYRKKIGSSTTNMAP